MLACLVRSACSRGDEDYCEPVVGALRFEEKETAAADRVEAIVARAREVRGLPDPQGARQK